MLGDVVSLVVSWLMIHILSDNFPYLALVEPMPWLIVFTNIVLVKYQYSSNFNIIFGGLDVVTLKLFLVV